MHIFDMADQNLDSLKTRYNLLKEGYADPNNFAIFSNFVKLVKRHWTISLNMRQWVLNDFLIGGNYKNIYEVKKRTKRIVKRRKKIRNTSRTSYREASEGLL